MLHYAFIEFLVVDFCYGTYFDLFDLFIGNISAADIILIFGEVDDLLMAPKPIFGAFGEGDTFLKFF